MVKAFDVRRRCAILSKWVIARWFGAIFLHDSTTFCAAIWCSSRQLTFAITHILIYYIYVYIYIYFFLYVYMYIAHADEGLCCLFHTAANHTERSLEQHCVRVCSFCSGYSTLLRYHPTELVSKSVCLNISAKLRFCWSGQVVMKDGSHRVNFSQNQQHGFAVFQGSCVHVSCWCWDL